MKSPLFLSGLRSATALARVWRRNFGTHYPAVGLFGVTELVDPVDQRERLEEQARMRSEGDDETMMLEEDFLEAISFSRTAALLR